MHDDLTAQDIEMMQKELDHRKLELMPELIEEVKRTRAFGDLSENFEYYAAKREKNRNESRIRFLERMIKTAEVISDDSKEDEIGVNNTVELFFEEDGTTETMKIVTTMRGNSLEGLVSTESPIGRALLGHREGDRVYVEVNSSYGYYVMIDHGNGLSTLYAHNSQLLVRVGQTVEAGDIVSLSGSTGRSTGPHLHFEVRVSGQRTNPRYYLPTTSYEE